MQVGTQCGKCTHVVFFLRHMNNKKVQGKYIPDIEV